LADDDGFIIVVGALGLFGLLGFLAYVIFMQKQPTVTSPSDVYYVSIDEVKRLKKTWKR